MAEQQNTVEPVFFNNADMPDPSTSTMTVVKAVTGIIDAQYLEGVQKFNHLWRIYFKTLGSREQFLAQKTVLIKGKMVSLHQQSPEEQTEKLTIKGLPLSIGNKEVKDFLLSKNIKPLSRVMYSYIRDDDGARTGFKDGDRFVYCHPFDPLLPRRQTIHGYPCAIYRQGRNRSTCKSCNLYGHKAGDHLCPARKEKGSNSDAAIRKTAEDPIVSLTNGVTPSITEEGLPDKPNSLDTPQQIPIDTNTVRINTKSDPSSTDENKEENEDSQKGTALTDVPENQNTSNRYKLTIKGLPLSIQNKEIRKFLLSKDIKPSSEIKYSYIKDNDGTDTRWKDGDRFVYCHPSGTRIPLEQNIRGHHCTLHTSSD